MAPTITAVKTIVTLFMALTLRYPIRFSAETQRPLVELQDSDRTASPLGLSEMLPIQHTKRVTSKSPEKPLPIDVITPR